MTADDHPDGRLFDLYREYIGEPEESRDVYLGFGLFLGGIGLAIIALVLFLWSNTYEPRSDPYFAWSGPAYALGMVSLPATMLGIVVLLPSERRVQYTSIVGAAVTLAAVAGFLFAHPNDWNGHGADYTVPIVATYAVGLAGITASTGAALIAHYLDLARTVEDLEEDEEEGESYTDEEIRGDIDEAMEGVELSWGGVQKTEHKRLSFSDHDFDETNFDGEAKTTRSTGVDAQVAGLKGLKGGEKKTATSNKTVDDQTAKLKELREQKRREEAQAATENDGPLAVLGARLAALKRRFFGSGGTE